MCAHTHNTQRNDHLTIGSAASCVCILTCQHVVSCFVLQDFGTFYQAGITTWDAADHYGPAEVLIGRYLQQHPEQRQNIQVRGCHGSSLQCG